MNEKILKDAASHTPDRERSFKNLSSFINENPSGTDKLLENIRPVSLLFSYSQFLANYCIAKPDVLFRALNEMNDRQDRETMALRLRERILNAEGGVSANPARALRPSLAPEMTAVRDFKTEEILKITLRDILRKTDLVEIMIELSGLADVIINESLAVIRRSFHDIYGMPDDDAFAVIALGKLGGTELNFSSDVDLIFVYGTEVGETSGVKTGQGNIANRISNHEYYCKVGEELNRFLSMNTASGFAYRVDLRLRPEGQRGDLALALRGYEMYYESWGRAWERAMLIRARPVAGEAELGQRFLEMIRPFVYRKYLDFSSIDEIRRLKTRIDSTFKKGDIKRGFGGIREIEFFVQALQLIYGGKDPMLRERSTLLALHRLLQKNLVGQEDYILLSENYGFLRILEHRLQQLNDLQTHTLPSSEAELEVLGKKMGFQGRKDFLENLGRRRTQVRNIYNSLFTEEREEDSPSGTFFAEELSDSELREFLSQTRIRDPNKAVRNIKSIKDSIFTFQTLRGRRLLLEILPVFVDSAMQSIDPDSALNHLQSFTQLLSTNEPYLEIFAKNRELIDMLISVFSQSEYLSKMLMRRPQYLEMIGWEQKFRKSVLSLTDEIRAGISEGQPPNISYRLLKQSEEIRSGLLFLQKKIGIIDVVRELSKVAQAILSECMRQLAGREEMMCVIGLGKLGGREITFGSDLDIIFVSPGDVSLEGTRLAEKFLRILTSYTKEGIAYSIDTRLRPEGSKGPLVTSMESFRRYYAGAAAFWEFQALLKARPVAGSSETGTSFIGMAKETLMERGRKVEASDINQMRERILRELSREAEGYDIKLGPGGLEEVEFLIQYLQLVNCHAHSSLLVQGTLKALDRLRYAGILSESETKSLRDTYLFYRMLESYLRLRGRNVLKRDERELHETAKFVGFGHGEAFVEHLEMHRKQTGELYERYLTG
jgi:glutamate-ammonia-ligase adenylyltransferase